VSGVLLARWRNIEKWAWALIRTIDIPIYTTDFRVRKAVSGEPVVKLRRVAGWLMKRGTVDRRYFELCLFTQVMYDLKSGDLAVAGSDQWRDWREQLVSEDEFTALCQSYCVRAGVPVEAAASVQRLQASLRQTAIETDRAYPENVHLEIENGIPMLKRLKRKPYPEGRARLEQMIKERLQPTGIMEVLVDTQHWLDWTRRFGPISVYDAKLDDPVGRYIATTFCYGYHFGPKQTARSRPGSATSLFCEPAARNRAEAE